jgi:hypothetical protein
MYRILAVYSNLPIPLIVPISLYHNCKMPLLSVYSTSKIKIPLLLGITFQIFQPIVAIMLTISPWVHIKYLGNRPEESNILGT